jgi:hypothetical protein
MPYPKNKKLRKPSLLLDIYESNCDNGTQFGLFFGIVPQTAGRNFTCW